MGKNKTIYFRSRVWDHLEKMDNPGPLINDLLEAHFVGKNTAEQPSAASTPTNDDKPIPVDIPPQLGPNEKPCCKKPAPCQHWDWDGTMQVWRNTLSGRERANEA